MATRHRLSPHFVVEEFDCHDGTQIPSSWYPHFEHLAEWWLEPLRVQFGPVHVVSGFRTVSHNTMVGGAVHSVHLVKTPLPGGEVRARSSGSTARRPMACAADVVPARGNPAAWAAWARKMRKAHRHLGAQGRGGVGEYTRSGFVHLDTATLRDWAG